MGAREGISNKNSSLVNIEKICFLTGKTYYFKHSVLCKSMNNSKFMFETLIWIFQNLGDGRT